MSAGGLDALVGGTRLALPVRPHVEGLVQRHGCGWEQRARLSMLRLIEHARGPSHLSDPMLRELRRELGLLIRGGDWPVSRSGMFSAWMRVQTELARRQMRHDPWMAALERYGRHTLPDAGRSRPISELVRERSRYRPVPRLAAAVGRAGTLDREVVPLLNALWEKGIRTTNSCAGHVEQFGESLSGYVSVVGPAARCVSLLGAGGRGFRQCRVTLEGHHTTFGGKERPIRAQTIWILRWHWIGASGFLAPGDERSYSDEAFRRWMKAALRDRRRMRHELVHAADAVKAAKIRTGRPASRERQVLVGLHGAALALRPGNDTAMAHTSLHQELSADSPIYLAIERWDASPGPNRFSDFRSRRWSVQGRTLEDTYTLALAKL